MISVEKGRTEKKNAQSDQVNLKTVWVYDKQNKNESVAFLGCTELAHFLDKAFLHFLIPHKKLHHLLKDCTKKASLKANYKATKM